MRNKYSLEIIEEAFNVEGYKLISTTYINPHIKLKYICPNKHEHEIAWNKWLYGRRCPYCSKKAKYRIEDVRKSFDANGYVLLSNEYINAFTKLKYLCDKGHIGYVTWHNWKANNTRCMECRNTGMYGEGNFRWKGGISCEPYCDVWLDKEFKNFILARDQHRCQNPDCWKKFQRLSIHHIDYNKKNCSPENLITLCASCNSRANSNRDWHEAWYKAIMYNRGNVYVKE